MRTAILLIASICFQAQPVLGSTFATRGGWADVHLWRYWESRNGKMVERLLILNERAEPVEINVRVDTVELVSNRIYIKIDSAFGLVGGPWSVPAESYRIVPMPHVAVRDSNGYLYRFERADTSMVARMNIGQARPAAPVRGDWIVTTGAVDGGHSWKDYWWEQRSPVVRAGERVSGRLHVVAREWTTRAVHPEQFVLVLRWADSVMHGRKPLDLVRASSTARLKVDSTDAPEFPYTWIWPNGQMPARGFAFTLPDEPQGKQELLTFDFLVEAPTMNSPRLCRLPVFSSEEEISLPFVVIPGHQRGR